MKLFIILTLFIMLLAPDAVGAQELSCRLDRDEIHLGLDPHQETIKVYGQAPEQAPIIIKIEGPERPVLVSFNKDNSLIKFSEAEVRGLPGIYQVLTSTPVEEIKPTYWSLLGLNPEHNELRSSAWVRMRQDSDDAYSKWQNDYVTMAMRVKEEKGLYGVRQEVVHRQGKNYWANIPLVRGMPLGEIKVTALAVVNNRVVSSDTKLLKLKPSSILSTAQDLSISGILVISLFMVPIFLLTVAHILELLAQYKEERKRARLLRQISP